MVEILAIKVAGIGVGVLMRLTWAEGHGLLEQECLSALC